MANPSWIFITPQPGRGRFDPELLAALVSDSAPAHTWGTYSRLRGFAMKAEEFESWIKRRGPKLTAVVSAQHIRICPLDGDPQIYAPMLQLQMKSSGTVRGWPLART